MFNFFNKKQGRENRVKNGGNASVFPLFEGCVGNILVVWWWGNVSVAKI